MLDDEVNYWPTRTAPFFAPNFKLERQKNKIPLALYFCAR